MARLTLALATALAVAGCHRQVAAPPGARTPLPTDAWVGRWVGVEGLALDIQPRGAAGRYRLAVTLMDGTATYAGVGDGPVIRFTRNGRPATIRHVPGRETGLKWLDGKTDCLTIQPGEGFCRD